MIATTTRLPYHSAVIRTTPAAHSVHRRICPEAGHALEILSHAIEYLTDELVVAPEPMAANRGRLHAIELLMDVNRRIYNECPEMPTLAHRIAAWFRRLA